MPEIEINESNFAQYLTQPRPPLPDDVAPAEPLPETEEDVADEEVLLAHGIDDEELEDGRVTQLLDKIKSIFKK